MKYMIYNLIILGIRRDMVSFCQYFFLSLPEEYNKSRMNNGNTYEQMVDLILIYNPQGSAKSQLRGFKPECPL